MALVGKNAPSLPGRLRPRTTGFFKACHKPRTVPSPLRGKHQLVTGNRPGSSDTIQPRHQQLGGEDSKWQPSKSSSNASLGAGNVKEYGWERNGWPIGQHTGFKTSTQAA